MTASMKPHAQPLQGQQQQHVEGGDEDGPEERNVEEQVDRHGAAQHLGQVAGRDGDLADEPVRPARPRRVEVAARLGQVLAGDDAQPRGEDLHDDRHEARQGHDPQQVVAVRGAGLEVGPPVAGVHVADADEKRRARRRPATAARSRRSAGGTGTVLCSPSRDRLPIWPLVDAGMIPRSPGLLSTIRTLHLSLSPRHPLAGHYSDSFSKGFLPFALV